jgi:FkbM family methyltransferase
MEFFTMTSKFDVINTAKKIKHLILGTKQSPEFPVRITLNANFGKVHFEAFSPVELYRTANYGDEKLFVDKFTESIKADDIIFDIGASVGLMTVHAAVLLSKKGQIIAFEPDPDTMERLKHNVSLNSVSNVVFVSWAVSDGAGEVSLFTDGASGNAPTLREQIDREGCPKNQITVQTKTLDSEILASNLPLPTVLKIDIEGAEVLCLRGAQKLLSGQLGEKPRLIFLELHPQFLPSFGTTGKEVHNFVLNHGYSVVWEQKRDDQVHYCYQPN